MVSQLKQHVKSMPLIAIIIPVHNRKDITLQCLGQLRNIDSDYFDFQVVVIDDGSSDGTCEAVANDYPEVTLLRGDGNLWWAGGINMGFRYVLNNDFDFVYTMNDDVELSENTLQRLLLSAQKYHAAIASIAVDPDSKKIVGSGYTITGMLRKMRPLLNGLYYKDVEPGLHSVDALSSMSTLIPVDIIEDVGFYDEKTFPHNYSDIDYSIRIKRKLYGLYVDKGSVIYTKGSGSNFHHLLLSKSLAEIFRSFFDMKYGYNIKTLFNSATIRTNAIYAVPVFLNRLFPYMVWTILRIFTTKKYLYKILKNTNRID